VTSGCVVAWPENVPKYGEDHESGVDGDGDPEHYFVAQRFLKINENHQSHSEASDGAGNVGHERHLCAGGRVLESSVDGVTEVGAYCVKKIE